MIYSNYFYSCLVGFLFSCSLVGVAYSSNIPHQKVIAITQIVAHPSLDQVRQGVMDELSDQGYREEKGAKILFESAQGNISLAAQIAQHFVGEHPDVIVAITTPSAQTVMNATKGKHIPVVMATITDPIQAKLVSDLKHPGGEVTGTRNVTPIARQLALIKRLLPNAKRLGIVLNYGEENSVTLLKKITDEAKLFSLQVMPVGITSSAEVQAATASLMGKVDVLLLLQDNAVAAGVPALLSVAEKNKLPVFSTYLDAVSLGALASIAPNEYLIGRQTGKMVVKILHGQKAGEMSVEDPKDVEFALNLVTAKKLNIVIPQKMIHQAQRIFPRRDA